MRDRKRRTPKVDSGLGSSRTPEVQHGELDTESRGIGKTHIGQTEGHGAHERGDTEEEEVVGRPSGGGRTAREEEP
jgi:hypothetical protein